jgi:hypothetical protein
MDNRMTPIQSQRTQQGFFVNFLMNFLDAEIATPR